MDQLHTILIIEQVLHGLVVESYRLLHLMIAACVSASVTGSAGFGGRSVIFNAERIKDTPWRMRCRTPAALPWCSPVLHQLGVNEHALADYRRHLYRAQTHNNRRAGPCRVLQPREFWPIWDNLASQCSARDSASAAVQSVIYFKAITAAGVVMHVDSKIRVVRIALADLFIDGILFYPWCAYADFTP